jgi:hypothetical protein
MAYFSQLNNKVFSFTSGNINIDSKNALSVNIAKTKSDLVSISNYINEVLYPLFLGLPSGPIYMDPVQYGLSGASLLSYSIAAGNSSNETGLYWSAANNGRPTTVKESFDFLLNKVSALESAAALDQVEDTTIQDQIDLLSKRIYQLFYESYGNEKLEHHLTVDDEELAIPDFTFSSLLYQVYNQLIIGHTSNQLSILDNSSHAGFSLKINKAAIELELNDLVDVIVESPENHESLVFNGTEFVNKVISLADDTSGDYVEAITVANELTKQVSNNAIHNKTINIALSESGVTAGTYTKVSVDTFGRVTNSIEATTLLDYGITDAINTSEKGQANGVVPLNSSGFIESSYLPSYVDDVLEYSSLSSFPDNGSAGKIYVDLATNKIYRWSGTTYIEISPGSPNAVVGLTGVTPVVIGGTSTNPTVSVQAAYANTPNYLVLRNASGNIVVSNILCNEVQGNATTATALRYSRNISLTGAVSGTVAFDGSQNVSMVTSASGLVSTAAVDQTVLGLKTFSNGIKTNYLDIGVSPNESEIVANNTSLILKSNNSTSSSILMMNNTQVSGNVSILNGSLNVVDTGAGISRGLYLNSAMGLINPSLDITAIEVNRGASTASKMIWNETLDQWQFTHPLYANLSGNAATATKIAAPVNIQLTGEAAGSASFDGSQNIEISTTIKHKLVFSQRAEHTIYVGNKDVTTDHLTGNDTPYKDGILEYNNSDQISLFPSLLWRNNTGSNLKITFIDLTMCEGGSLGSGTSDYSFKLVYCDSSFTQNSQDLGFQWIPLLGNANFAFDPRFPTSPKHLPLNVGLSITNNSAIVPSGAWFGIICVSQPQHPGSGLIGNITAVIV